MPKSKSKSYNKTLLVLIVIVIAAYSIFSLYVENQKQASVISSLLQQLSDKSKIIENLNANLESLDLTINNLKSDLKSKELTVTDLRNRLGLTETELQGLTPIVKNYFAVGVSGKIGVLIPLEVKMTKGTGVVSVNIKNVDLQSGAQDSIRLATQVAQDYTNVDLSERDITVTFVNDEPTIVSLDGPSAGAAITLTMIAGVLNKTPNTKILITGTIEDDGTIGQVGGVREKALATVEGGATVFLVPFGQKVDVGGIEVVEVRKVQEIVNLVLK